MIPFYQDNFRTIYNKSSLDMSEIPDETIQCVVTSPPYWGLRKYAGEQDLIWDNHNGCQHIWESVQPARSRGVNDVGSNPKQGQDAAAFNAVPSGQCSLCSAWRGSFGLEPTPVLYIQHSMQFLKEIHRVLRKDGTVFWNLGDSYSGSGGTGNQFGQQERGLDTVKPSKPTGALKPKDLCLIPFRFAITAQEANWWVRSVIIWSKNNPMPESVKDRPTESHEYIFLLTKSARYYWDQEAVRDPQKECSLERLKRGWNGNGERGYPGGVQNPIKDYMSKTDEEIEQLPGANLKSVWTFSTQPYKDAHFATFPEALPERCIKAGSKEGDIVLDPFAGSGTTLEVSTKLGRRSIGYELSTEYCELNRKRNSQQAIL